MKKIFLIIGLLMIFLMSACAPANQSVEQFAESPALGVTKTSPPVPTTEIQAAENTPPVLITTPTEILSTATVTPDARPNPLHWQLWPVIPNISARAMEIYQAGIASGSDPHAFSKVGDCQSVPDVFLGIYDYPGRYTINSDYAYLEDTINYFSGSFNRTNITAQNGLTVVSLYTPLWSDPEVCESNESPLACEIRLHNPSIVFISLGTNWPAGDPHRFDQQLRQVVEDVINSGALPVLLTKADNVEEDNFLNELIAFIAYDYDIPLLNFWRAAQNLPNQGLDDTQSDRLVYLTVDGWSTKSFTALQTLDVILKAVGGAD